MLGFSSWRPPVLKETEPWETRAAHTILVSRVDSDGLSTKPCHETRAAIRPISVLRLWISEGLTQAES